LPLELVVRVLQVEGYVFYLTKCVGSSSIYTQVEEERHTHIQNANQVAPAALARAGVFTTGVEASKFWIDNDERAR
jgi:hypothetical protein